MSTRPLVERLDAAGLGLDYDDLQLARTTTAWVAAGDGLRTEVVAALECGAADLEMIGSASVPGLLAKPIVDLAITMPALDQLPEVTRRLEAAGWIYRGDAGDDGGHVFVLESRPWHRVAHAHVVVQGDPQWGNWIRLRDLLRVDPTARTRYETVKTQLMDQHGKDRAAYIEGKTEVVRSLLSRSNNR